MMSIIDEAMHRHAERVNKAVVAIQSHGELYALFFDPRISGPAQVLQALQDWVDDEQLSLDAQAAADAFIELSAAAMERARNA